MHDVKRSPFPLADCSMITHVPVSDRWWRKQTEYPPGRQVERCWRSEATAGMSLTALAPDSAQAFT